MIYRTTAPPDYPPPAPAPTVVETARVRATANAMRVVDGGDLFRRTLRTVAMLVGACVVFVGALSVVAVLVTTRALGPRTAAERTPTVDAPDAKKPLSI